VAQPAAASLPKKQGGEAAEEIDVLSEADLFLTYGRDAQAESLLQQALSRSPNNLPIQTKLLSIYANRKDVNAFTTIARQIKDSGDASAWEQTAALGRTIDPGNPMYGTGQGAPAAASPNVAAETAQPVAMPLDMDIGFNIPMDLDVTSAGVPAEKGPEGMDFDVSALDAPAVAMDFDVTGSHPNVTEALLPDFDVTGGHQTVQPSQQMDFDVTGSQPNVVVESKMDFDVTGSHPNVIASASEQNIGAAPLEGTMDFDLGNAAAGTSEASLGLGGLDFDVTGSHAPIVSAEPEPGTGGMGMGGAMDFDVSARSEEAAQALTGLGGLDFNLTGGQSLASAGTAEMSASSANVSTGALSASMDFSLDSMSPAASPAATALEGLDFDVSTGSHSRAAASPEEKGAQADANMNTVVLGGAMDFDISAPAAAAAPAIGEASGLSGLDFNLGTGASMVIPTEGGGLSGLGGMDFDLSSPSPAIAEPATDLGFGGISLDLAAGDTVVSPVAEAKKGEHWEEVKNKLELAVAYQNMGDVDTARELLREVLDEGDAQQVEAARAAMQQL
jgi:pilus assembly protein FimV